MIIAISLFMLFLLSIADLTQLVINVLHNEYPLFTKQDFLVLIILFLNIATCILKFRGLTVRTFGKKIGRKVSDLIITIVRTKKLPKTIKCYLEKLYNFYCNLFSKCQRHEEIARIFTVVTVILLV